jgi:hypothetical protein
VIHHNPDYVAGLAAQLRERRPDALDAAADDLSALTAELAIDQTTHPDTAPEKPHG